MNPRLLVLNFDNHAPREQLDRLVDKTIAAIAEGSRYHGYSDSNAPVFLQYQVFEFVELRDTNAPKSGLNSRLFPTWTTPTLCFPPSKTGVSEAGRTEKT